MSMIDDQPAAARRTSHHDRRDRWPGACPGSNQVVSRYFLWKPAVGRILAVLLLVPGLPLMALLVLLVRLTSRGPGIYRQVRVGLHGQIFQMYKIRSMRQDAEVRSGPVWTKNRDPRVTRLGSILRKLHLDELPQLINVVRGEMSLIGPRPERPEFVEVLSLKIPDYLQRLAVRPGVTGLAQVNLPPDTDLDSVRRKLVLDLEYIRRANVSIDIRLLICTVARMFRISLVSLMGLRRKVTLPESTVDPLHEAAGGAASVAELKHANGFGKESNGNEQTCGLSAGDDEGTETLPRKAPKHHRHNSASTAKPR